MGCILGFGAKKVQAGIKFNKPQLRRRADKLLTSWHMDRKRKPSSKPPRQYIANEWGTHNDRLLRLMFVAEGFSP